MTKKAAKNCVENADVARALEKAAAATGAVLSSTAIVRYRNCDLTFVQEGDILFWPDAQVLKWVQQDNTSFTMIPFYNTITKESGLRTIYASFATKRRRKASEGVLDKESGKMMGVASETMLSVGGSIQQVRKYCPRFEDLMKALSGKALVTSNFSTPWVCKFNENKPRPLAGETVEVTKTTFCDYDVVDADTIKIEE